jgi:hypothetical protein
VRTPLSASVHHPDVFPDAGTLRRGSGIGWSVFFMNPAGALALLEGTGQEKLRARARQLDAAGIPHPSVLIDYLYGKPTVDNALHILRNVPAGVSEIVFHLGTGTRSTEHPTGLDESYFPSRQKELALATSTYLRRIAEGLDFHPIGFSDLSNP